MRVHLLPWVYWLPRDTTAALSDLFIGFQDLAVALTADCVTQMTDNTRSDVRFWRMMIFFMVKTADCLWLLFVFSCVIMSFYTWCFSWLTRCCFYSCYQTSKARIPVWQWLLSYHLNITLEKEIRTPLKEYTDIWRSANKDTNNYPDYCYLLQLIVKTCFTSFMQRCLKNNKQKIQKKNTKPTFPVYKIHSVFFSLKRNLMKWTKPTMFWFFSWYFLYSCLNLKKDK